MQKASNLILSPLYSETKYLVESLKQNGFELEEMQVEGLNVFYCSQLDSWFTSAALGKVEYALKAQFWIQKLEGIKNLICAGSAGSLGEMNPLDVVIASSIVEHDFKSILKDFKPPEYNCSQEWVKKAKFISNQNKNLFVGKITSGDEDIVDPLRMSEIKVLTGALAVSWEGAGAAKASQFNKLCFLEIRAITDMANAKTFEDFKKNLKPAMESLARILISLLSS